MNDGQYRPGLAQAFSIVTCVPEPALQVTDPALLRMPSGRLLASWSLRDHGGPGIPGWDSQPRHRVRLALSDDDGQSWEELPPLKANTAHPFLHRGELHMLVDGRGRRDLMITRSVDEGANWSPFTTLFKGGFWNTPSSTATAGDFRYFGFGTPNPSGHYNSSESGLVVVAADLRQNLMDRSAWRISASLRHPETPPELRAGLSDRQDHWLEPNVVNVRGRLRVLARLRIDHQATASMAAVCDLHDDGSCAPTLCFSQFYPIPGAQGNFFILPDATGLFWMLSNLPTDSQNGQLQTQLKARGFTDISGGAGDERRLLMLSCSVDALNWITVGCLAITADPLQSFHYPFALIEGEDLLFLSRTSRDAPNHHDSDLITFHRLSKFRSLAPQPMNPQFRDVSSR